MSDGTILGLLFSTVAVLVATLTGLIGAFSTFRLQNIYNELAHLIQTMRSRPTTAGTLDEWIERHDYSLTERIYDTGPKALTVLRYALDESGLSANHVAYEHDYANIAGNQARYLAVKRANHRSFWWVLLYVFISLLLLIFTKALLQLPPPLLITCLAIYLALAAYTFVGFMRQLLLMTIDP